MKALITPVSLSLSTLYLTVDSAIPSSLAMAE